MCLTLYIGSDIALPRIPWNKDQPRFNTRNLEEEEKPLAACFTYPEITYAGGDEGCGCGFRHAILSGAEWLPIVSDNQQGIDNERKNHQDLFDYITSHIKQGKIELLACWNGEINVPPRAARNINVTDLLKDDFYFKEDTFYSITI